MKGKCERRVELAANVKDALAQLVELTSAQLTAFESRGESEFMRLDKQLANAVGHKERCIGALREHEKEHGCQG
jgi:hypothetical protein